MPQAKRPIENLQDKIAKACLSIALRGSDQDFNLEAIAKGANVQRHDLQRFFNAPKDIPAFLIACVDDQLESAIDTTAQSGPLKDRVFDVVMRRFDLLQENRAACLAFARICRQSPSFLPQALKAHWRSQRKMLLLAGLPEKNESFTLNQFALFFIFQLTFAKWEKDKSQDMASTMALLDRLLKKLPHCDYLL